MFLKNFSFAISIIIFVFFLHIRFQKIFSYHYDISGSEHTSITATEQIVKGIPMYGDPTKFNFILHNYTPTYNKICALFFKIFKFNSSEVINFWFLSRILSLIFISISFFFVFKLINKYLPKKESAFFIIFLFCFFQYLELTISRVDSLLLLEFVLIMYFFNRYIEFESKIFLYLTIFLCAFAPFTKQNGLFYATTPFLFLIIQKRFKHFIYAMLIYCIFFATFLFYFSEGFSVNFFKHSIGGIKLPAKFIYFKGVIDNFFKAYFLIFIAFLIFCFNNLRKLKNDPVFYFCIISFTIAFGTSFKEGSGVGYYHEFFICSIILIARNIQNSRIVIPIFIIYQIYFAVAETKWFKRTSYTEQKINYLNQKEVSLYIIKNGLDKKDGIIFKPNGTKDRGSFISDFLLENVVAKQEDLTYATLKNKTFNYDDFFKMIRKNEIKYVIIENIDKNNFRAFDYDIEFSKYRLLKNMHGYNIFINKIYQN